VRDMPRVTIAGGSVGGLTAALVLRDIGCDVQVLERSSTALQARGVGIAALDTTLEYLVKRGGFQPSAVCTSTEWIRFLNRDGTVRYEEKHKYQFSSWNTIYRALLGLFDADRYTLGAEVTAFSERADTVTAALLSGSRIETDLLICADGVGSAARARLLPEVTPAYAGYVAWRGTVPERQLSASAREAFRGAITYQLLPHSHVLVYPIPALDGSIAEGDRLMNVVWYVNVAAGAPLDAIMTDTGGIRRQISLPPGAAAPATIASMRRAADEQLTSAIAEVMLGIPDPFIQAVYDIEVPRMVFGRICLIGDAAFAVRPHAAAGTAKAAADGWELARELVAAGGDVPAALAAWERRQLALGRSLLARCRDIGNSSQFTGTFRPGDPQLLFGLYGPGN
jgi:2,6-dihydroxypyridine 3-monooxygenase